MRNKKTIANYIFIEKVRELLNEDKQVSIRVKGRSMTPFLIDGRDSVRLINPVHSPVEVGKIALAETLEGVYVLHRVIGLREGVVTLMGDGNLDVVERVPLSQVIGVVVSVERNGRKIECSRVDWRFWSWVWYHLLPFRKILLKQYRRLQRYLFKTLPKT